MHLDVVKAIRNPVDCSPCRVVIAEIPIGIMLLLVRSCSRCCLCCITVSVIAYLYCCCPVDQVEMYDEIAVVRHAAFFIISIHHLQFIIHETANRCLTWKFGKESLNG